MPYIRLKVNEEGILHKLFRFLVTYSENRASQVVLVVKTPANAEVIRDLGLIPGSGRSPGGGHSNPPTPVFLPEEPPQTEEPGALQFIEAQRVGYD